MNNIDFINMYCMVEEDVSVFNGDFDKFLLSIGVAREHIEKMKNKLLQKSKDDYYTKPINEREMRLVPLDKVIGTSRGTIGESVYENVRKIKIGERETSRFINCFSYLKNMPFDELKTSYQNLGNIDCVQMNYYLDDDEYYVINGNHRTLTAMLLGAPYIRASVKTIKCDYEVKEKVVCAEQFYHKYSIQHIYASCHGCYEIEMMREGKYYCVDGFIGQQEGDGCVETINKLEQQIKDDLRIVNIVNKIPSCLRKVFLFLTNKKRIVQYLTPLKGETEWNPYKREIYLYKLEAHSTNQ